MQNEDKIKVIKHEPEVYRLYDHLKNKHLGNKNGILKRELANELGITERHLRKLTSEINASTQLEKLVSTTGSCYMCETKEECTKSIRNTYNVAIALFKKAKQMEKKVKLNGQIKLKLGKYYKDVIETFEE